MKRTSHFLASIAAAGLALAMAASPVQAASKTSPTASAGTQSKAALAVVTSPRILVRTRVSSDNTLVAVPAGFQPIDAGTTLTCPATAASCLIVAEQNVQVIGTAASNRWAICTQVDGAFLTNPNCPFLGFVPVGFFGANSFAQSSNSLAPGVHTVRTFLFTDFGASRSIYELTYAIYK